MAGTFLSLMMPAGEIRILLGTNSILYASTMSDAQLLFSGTTVHGIESFSI